MSVDGEKLARHESSAAILHPPPHSAHPKACQTNSTRSMPKKQFARNPAFQNSSSPVSLPHPTTRRRPCIPNLPHLAPATQPDGGSHPGHAAAPTGCISGPTRHRAASHSPPIVPRCCKWLASMRRVRRVSGKNIFSACNFQMGQAENSGGRWGGRIVGN